jgi:pimeloyl-ACP methyl ester carboxylesterase
MFRTLSAAVLLLSVLAPPLHAEDCAADNLTRVRGADECLVIKTFGERAQETTLLVFIHGDGSGGGASDYLYKFAPRYAAKGTVVVGLIRPGYFDSNDNKSTGTSYRSAGDGYRAWVIESVAGAVTALKKFHGAAKVVLVGHSGGAAISGVILGRFPGLADAALLAACPCNVPEWRIMRRGKNNWTSSQSPHEFIDAIPAASRVIAVTGSRDNNTFPKIAVQYVESLQKRGIDARYVEVEGASHNSVTQSDAFHAAIAELLK